MKQYFSVILSLALALGPVAPAFAETFRNDEVKFGRPASGADKVLNFDQGQGANNPRVQGASDGSIKARTNTFKIGKGTATTQVLEADQGAGAANPKLRFNTGSAKWEFLNDGVTAKELGSGGGSGSGYTLNDNSGFESGTTSWTASGGTFSAVTNPAGGVPGAGLLSAMWTPNAIGQTLSSTAVAVPGNLLGKNCTLSWYYRGGDTGYRLRVLNGATEIATSSPFTAQTAWSAKQVYSFTCPTSGNVQAQFITSTASPAIIYLDDVRLGQDVITIGGAEGLMGSAKFNFLNNCSTTFTNSSLFDDGTTTTCAAPIFTGTATATGTTATFGLKFATLPKGEYVVFFSGGRLRSGGGTVNAAAFRIFDGTNIIDSKYVGITPGASANQFYANSFMGRVSYATDQTNLVIRLQGRAVSGNGIAETASADEAPIEIAVYRMGAGTADAGQGITVDQTGWKVNGTITGASDPTISTNADYLPLATSGLTMTLGDGSFPATLPCSGTNPSTGTTGCAAGTPQFGLVTSVPAAGIYEVCLKDSLFTFQGSTGQGSLFETKVLRTAPASDATIVASPETTITASDRNGGADHSTGVYQTGEVCSDFTLAGPGSVAFRLGAKFTGAGTARLLISGGRNFSFKIRRKVEFADVVKVAPPANSVLTSRPLGAKIEFVAFGGAVEGTNVCATSPCTLYRQTPGVSSVTRLAGGQYTVNFAAGTFTIPPVCTERSIQGTRWAIPNALATINSSSFSTYDGASVVDASFNVTCMGY